jgi:hypothetical protein
MKNVSVSGYMEIWRSISLEIMASAQPPARGVKEEGTKFHDLFSCFFLRPLGGKAGRGPARSG